MRSRLQPYQGTLGGLWPCLSPSLLSFIPPSSVSLSSGLASGFCSQVSFFFILILLFRLTHFIFWFYSFSLFRSECRSFSLAIGRTPSLFISLPVYRWVRVSLSCIRPSLCLFVHACVCLSVSVRQAWGGGRGAHGMWAGTGEPSLPARLVILSQSLRRAAHLCEALGVRAGAHAHPTFLWRLELCQDVPDLPLSQLEDRGKTTIVSKVKAAPVRNCEWTIPASTCGQMLPYSWWAQSRV